MRNGKERDAKERKSGIERETAFSEPMSGGLHAI